MIAKGIIKTLLFLIILVVHSALGVWALDYPPVFLGMLVIYSVGLFFFIFADMQERQP